VLRLTAVCFVVGVGGSVTYTVYNDYLAPRKPAETAVEEVQVKPKDARQTFVGGDQGFIGLKLAEVSDVNHNVKRLRFALPDKDEVSGLTVTCGLDRNPCWA
jgi:cytochrome-b5 reductase